MISQAVPECVRPMELALVTETQQYSVVYTTVNYNVVDHVYN